MVGADATRAAVMLRQIVKLAADMESGQAEEIDRTSRPHLAERAVQPEQSVLHHVARLFPALNAPNCAASSVSIAPDRPQAHRISSSRADSSPA